MILVSKCLTGECCRYDGKASPDKEIVALVERGEAYAVCPEQLGGLSTPRTPAELTGTGEDVLDGKAKAVTADGRDVTEAFIRGAEKTLELAKKLKISGAILKAKSPSCGKGRIYDGSFTKKLVSGSGVTAALLMRNGYDVEVR